MRKMIWCAGLFILMGGSAYAQKAGKKGAVKQQPGNKQVVKQNASTKEKKQADTSNTVQLISMGNYNAFAGTAEGSKQLVISDPVVKAFTIRANTGRTYNVDLRQLTGAGKGAYGIAKGQITLVPVGARTTGSITGSGSVGTGTSTGVLGSSGPAMGLNGKNPYAGPGVFGVEGLGVRLADSTFIKRPY